MAFVNAFAEFHFVFWLKFVDGDLVTIFDTSDLAFAIHCSKILKLSLFGEFLRNHTSKFKQIKVLYFHENTLNSV